MSKNKRTLEERIDSACQSVLSRIPKELHCEDLYQDIACLYLDIYSKHPDYKHSVICNQIYYFIDKLINKYKNNNCDYILLPEYIIADEDDMMFIIVDIFKTIKPFLTEREFDIICRRYINNETLKDIASMHNIHKSRIGQIENKSIRKLRRPVCAKLIRDFYR